MQKALWVNPMTPYPNSCDDEAIRNARERELLQISTDFWGPKSERYHDRRKNFVRKVKPLKTPLRFAKHRRWKRNAEGKKEEKLFDVEERDEFDSIRWWADGKTCGIHRLTSQDLLRTKVGKIKGEDGPVVKKEKIDDVLSKEEDGPVVKKIKGEDEPAVKREEGGVASSEEEGGPAKKKIKGENGPVVKKEKRDVALSEGEDGSVVNKEETDGASSGITWNGQTVEKVEQTDLTVAQVEEEMQRMDANLDVPSGQAENNGQPEGSGHDESGNDSHMYGCYYGS